MCACVSTTASSVVGIERQLAPVQLAQVLAPLEQPAVDEHAAAVDLEQMLRAGHGARGAVEGQADHRGHSSCAAADPGAEAPRATTMQAAATRRSEPRASRPRSVSSPGRSSASESTPRAGSAKTPPRFMTMRSRPRGLGLIERRVGGAQHGIAGRAVIGKDRDAARDRDAAELLAPVIDVQRLDRLADRLGALRRRRASDASGMISVNSSPP